MHCILACVYDCLGHAVLFWKTQSCVRSTILIVSFYSVCVYSTVSLLASRLNKLELSSSTPSPQLLYYTLYCPSVGLALVTREYTMLAVHLDWTVS